MSQTSFFGEAIDLTNTKASTGFEPLPAGVYPAMLIDIECVPKDWGLLGKVKFKVTEGEFAGRLIMDNLTMVHRTSQQANDIGQSRLRAWCDAAGVQPNLTSAEPLLHKTVLVKVKVEGERKGADGKTYGPQNRIETFTAYEGAAAAPVTFSAPAPAPAQRPAASPAATAAVPPVQAAAAGAAAKAMPWEKRA